MRRASKSRLEKVEWDIDLVLRLSPLVVACFENADDMSVLGTAFWQTTSLCAFERNAEAAIQMVEIVAKSSPSSFDSVAATLNDLLAQRKFIASLKSLQLVNMLLSTDMKTTITLERSKIVDACIHTLVRELSAQVTLRPEISSYIKTFSEPCPSIFSQAILTSSSSYVIAGAVGSCQRVYVGTHSDRRGAKPCDRHFCRAISLCNHRQGGLQGEDILFPL